MNEKFGSSWTSQDQTTPYPTGSHYRNLLSAGFGVGALSILGPWEIRPGYSLADTLASSARAIEEYSPSKIFRTFQFSQMLSPLETASKQLRYFSPEMVRNMMGKGGVQSNWLNWISQQAGEELSPQLAEHGFRFEGNQLLLGRTGDQVLLKHASVIRNITGALPHYQESYMRSLVGTASKAQTYKGVFREAVEFLDISGTRQREVFSFFGAQSKGQSAWRATAGWGTSMVERFNRLAKFPSEEPLRSILNKVPLLGKIQLGVKSESGLRTLGRLAGKLGIALPAAYLGYQQLDYYVRDSKLLDKTIFEEGLTAAAATVGVKANLLVSRAAELLGLHAYREKQEEIAPGSTSLLKLAAFPTIGALTGAGINYGQRVTGQIGLQKAGYSIAEASGITELTRGLFKQRLYPKTDVSLLVAGLTEKGIEEAETRAARWEQTRLGLWAKQIALVQQKGTWKGTLARVLGEVTPGKIKGLAGIAAGLALVAPFIPGALIPNKRPGELEAIYSGKQQVPIKKGRFWEFGRCNTYMSPICVSPGRYKSAKDITLEDKLIARSGICKSILGIYRRHYKGPVIHLTTALDRNIKTGLTPNHIVPVLKETNTLDRRYVCKNSRKIEQVQVNDIRVGDFVQVPLPQIKGMNKNGPPESIELAQYITAGFYLIKDDKILPAQRNWFHGKLQPSKGVVIPQKVQLTHRLGRLIGYFLAEGNLSFHNDIPAFIETVHAVDEKWIVEDIQHICLSVFGIMPTVRFKKGKKETDQGCWIVRICSSLLARIFFSWFYSGNRQNEKQIPWWFLDLDYYFVNAILLGLWRGDGHLTYGRHILSTCHVQFVEFVKTLLLSQKIVPSVPKVERCCYVKKNGQDSIRYKIGWNPDSEAQNSQGYQWVDDQLFVRVIAVELEEEYDHDVYDFEIDDPDHLFQAGTFLVHNSPYEGEKIDYYRQHWYPRMLARGRDKALYGEEEESPVKRWFKKNFTYAYEKQHYYDRPYPITGTAFQDTPLVGPLLAATVGKLIKPPKLMHTEEWLDEEGGTLTQPLKVNERPPVTDLGEKEKGSPVSPFGTKGVVGEQAYRLTEMIGLPGFAMTSLKERLTGTPEVYDQEMQLASAQNMIGSERAYWDQSLGGALGMSELVRRLYPHRRRQIEQYNPLENIMPSWLPGPGERGPDLRHGDPFAAIPEGEIRLPGPGMAALYPELKGVEPEDYSDIWKLHVLGDVAPYSESYGRMLGQVQSQYQAGHLSKEEGEHFREIRERVSSQKKRKEFTPYKYTTRGETEAQETLAKINRESKSDKEPSWFSRAVGTYWEQLAHHAETPMEYLTPLSPAMKMVHMRTAIEDYERTQLYGTKNAFWQHPVKDFIKPALSAAGHLIGIDSIPKDVQQQREVEEYFDVLKYVKATRLEQAAQDAGRKDLQEQYGRQRRETLFGINPFSMDFSQIFRSLPRRERDYFSEFAKASPEERKQILNMIPENEKSLYVAHWQTQDAQDWQQVALSSEASEKQIAKAESAMSNLQSSRASAGFPQTQELWVEYQKTRMENESYPDWYRRTYLLAKRLEGRVLPGPDWVGFDPRVDLDDVKMKVVERLGGSMYDYDIWPDRVKAGARKPYLDQAANELTGFMDSSDVREQVVRILDAHDIDVKSIATMPAWGKDNQVDLDVTEDRSREIGQRMRGMIRG